MISKSAISGIPENPGVYYFKSKDGKIIYAGKAVSLKDRVSSYFSNDDPKSRGIVSNSSSIEYIVTSSEKEALMLEYNLIKENRPHYNVKLRDDKRYPYIRISVNEDFPAISICRKPVKDKAKYFGPYTSTKSMKKTLRFALTHFPVRDCKIEIGEPDADKICLNYQMHKCPAPCAGRIKKEEYRAIVDNLMLFLSGKTEQLLSNLKAEMDEFSEQLKYENAANVRDVINAIEYTTSRQVISGDSGKEDRDVIGIAVQNGTACVQALKVREGRMIGKDSFFIDGVENGNLREALKLFLINRYRTADFVPDEIIIQDDFPEKKTLVELLREKNANTVITIPKRGDKARLVTMAVRNAVFALSEEQLKTGEYSTRAPEILTGLADYLKLNNPPRRIEAFDISDIQGKHAAGGMVTFVDGKPLKKEYKKFRIKTVDSNDDFSMMKEVILRRYKRVKEEKLPFPDLILIDGGAGHVSVVNSALKSLLLVNLKVAGIAKSEENVYVPENSKPITMPKKSAELKLLMRIRDEVHRFANAYHRAIMKKKTTHSVLENIKGIGRKKAKLILQNFRNLEEAIQNPDKLMQVAKISRAKADEVVDFVEIHRDKY